MPFHARPISFKPPRLNGLSARLIASHYENNYGGAVRRLNAIPTSSPASIRPALPGFRLNGLKREELIATNSMLLHEVYFDSLGEGGGGDPPPTAGRRAGRGDRARLRLARALARRVRRHGQGAGRRLGLGGADPLAARRPAGQRLGGRPHAQPRRRHAAAGARHVRARLSPRLRQQRRGLCRRLHGQHRLAAHRRALRRRAAAAASRTRSTRRPRARCSRPIPTCW